jgi:hypothetical protein
VRLCPKHLRPCHSSFPRKRESILKPHPAWIPAFAGMTDPLSRLFGQSLPVRRALESPPRLAGGVSLSTIRPFQRVIVSVPASGAKDLPGAALPKWTLTLGRRGSRHSRDRPRSPADTHSVPTELVEVRVDEPTTSGRVVSRGRGGVRRRPRSTPPIFSCASSAPSSAQERARRCASCSSSESLHAHPPLRYAKTPPLLLAHQPTALDGGGECGARVLIVALVEYRNAVGHDVRDQEVALLQRL